MSKNVFHFAVTQGPQGPDGPPGEAGLEGPKVNLHTTLLKTSLLACEEGIDMVPLHDICQWSWNGLPELKTPSVTLFILPKNFTIFFFL